jgi:hypothetical protein
MRIRHVLAAAASLALVACADVGAPDSVVQGVAVYSQPVNSFDFGTLGAGATYFLSDVVTRKKDGAPDGTDSLSSTAYAPVKNAIVNQMAALGYTKVDTLAAADVGLQLGVGTATQDYYYSGGWCDIYYGWYGCYYPPVYAGSYTYGGAVLGMVDTRVPAAAGQQFPGVWFAAMYGVSTGGANPTRLAEAVNRAFDQSPYLNPAP